MCQIQEYYSQRNITEEISHIIYLDCNNITYVMITTFREKLKPKTSVIQ